MTTVWVPIYGDFDCPGRMILSADKHGITIRTRRKALGTTEWPGENVRLCQLVEEMDTPTQIPQEVLDAIYKVSRLYWTRYGPNETHSIVAEWLDKQKENPK